MGSLSYLNCKNENKSSSLEVEEMDNANNNSKTITIVLFLLLYSLPQVLHTEEVRGIKSTTSWLVWLLFNPNSLLSLSSNLPILTSMVQD